MNRMLFPAEQNLDAEHRVFRLRAPGSGVDGLRCYREPTPVIAEDEVLIKVHAVILNHRDIDILRGANRFPVKHNLVPCSDAAGEIVEVGAAMGGVFVIGEPVIVAFNSISLCGVPRTEPVANFGGLRDRVLRDYLAVEATAVVKIPPFSRLSFGQFASLASTGSTVWNALYGHVPLKPGQSVLVQGTGGISLTGLVIAKAAGATTFITSSSDQKLRLAKERYGADFIFNSQTNPDWPDEVNRITKHQGVDYVLDVGGASTMAQSLKVVAYGGNIALIGDLSRNSGLVMPDIASGAILKGCVLRGVTVGSRQQLAECVRFVARHNVDIPVIEEVHSTTMGFCAAIASLLGPDHMGKVCINFELEIGL